MTATQPAGTFVFKRMPADDEELWWWVQAVWGIKIPRTPVCKGHSTPFDAFADAYFARHPVAVWKASRGFGGKTNTLAALTLTEAVALGAQATLLGGSSAQSLRVHETITEAWASPNAPKALLSKDPTRYDTVLKNGAWIRALMASQTSVRGPHPQRLRLDEIDEMELDILEAAQGQPMYARGVETQTVMSSTHQYPDKTMTAILKRAREKGWPVYTWCYKETSNPVDGWLRPKDIVRKRTEISTHMFQVEYDLQEPSFGGRAIDTDSIDAAFSPDLGVFEGDISEKIQIADVEEFPRGKAPYITAVDWAKEHDWTIIATFDARQSPWVCVEWKRLGRMPWPVMVGEANKRFEKWGGKIGHDATGLGGVVADYIDSKDLKDFILQGRARADIFSEYINALESGDILYPRIQFAYDEHKFATLEDLYQNRGHPPDSFIAGAIAWAMRPRHHRQMEIPTSFTRESSPWVMT